MFAGREGVVSAGQSAVGKITASLYTLHKQSLRETNKTEVSLDQPP